MYTVSALFQSDLISCAFALDPLSDGPVRQLGLCEGRMQNAEIRGLQVQGGAGAA